MLENITDFCRTSDLSHSYWEIVKYSNANNVFNTPFSEIQKLWIAVCGRLEGQQKLDLVDQVLHRLEPWLNYELWEAQKKKAEDTHVNVEYEKQRKELFEKNVVESDLDIIR